MSEAIIARGGRKGGGSGSDFHGLMTEVYTSSTMWLVPSNAVNNEFSVRIFGGGGGWMNNDTLTLEPGTLIFINIGSGGESVEDSSYSGTHHPFWATSGGITSFGTYLSASGGSAPTIPNNDYRDESWYNATGGSGGAGGGGRLHGGRGYQFGGGGGGYGGNGGNYGGGGGGYGKSAFGGNNGGGGGGYYGRGGNDGGGGGGYGNGGNGTGRDDGGYGAGGGGSIRDTSLGGNGGDGICIIQYYVYE